MRCFVFFNRARETLFIASRKCGKLVMEIVDRAPMILEGVARVSLYIRHTSYSPFTDTIAASMVRSCIAAA
jgi:hypothetical protein